jgi:hypothetical protein
MAARSARRRRSRKRGHTAAPAVAPRSAVAAAPSARGSSGRSVGERPKGFFGGLPVSEFAILVGGIGMVVGLIDHGGPALIVGAIVCALGVLEVTAREHFSGYRSHTALLAAFPAVGAELAVVLLVGEPSTRAFLVVVVVPVFAVCFWLLRRRFLVARQARLVRPPAP